MSSLPNPPSRTEQVYDALVDDICTGRLSPGTQLRQEQLAARFNVSRQPVQQALLLLRNQGLVRDFRRRGLEVTPLDAEFVSHLYEMRAHIDAFAADLAARRRTNDWIAATTTVIDDGEQAYRESNFARMIRADVEFHRAVADASGNPLLIEGANVMWRNVQRVMGEVLLKGGSPAWVWEDHAGIFDAIVRGDATKAERLARRHAQHGERLILDKMPAPVEMRGEDGAVQDAPA